jgi:hypothetical protein
MKRILLIASILLLAAGCNKQTVKTIPNQNQQAGSNSSSTTEKNYAISDSTQAGWKVYTNPDLGFSVEYPSSWVFDSGVGGVSFTDSSGNQWMFNIEVASTNQTLQEASQVNKERLQYDNGLYATLQQKNVAVDGQVAIQNFYKAPNNSYYGDTETFVINQGNLYTISEGHGTDPNESTMFKSFKFTK